MTAAKLSDFARFESYITKHQITILVDDGVRRHLRLGEPGTYNCQFDILTWPGHLCYTGDLGTYVFSRIEDMLQFFRAKQPRGADTINLQYWAEKLLAVCKTDGFKEFTEDRFHEVIKNWFDSHEFESDADRTACWDEIEHELLPTAADGHDAALRAALEFQFHDEDIFPDFWEADLREYTGRFVTCCYALQWAIEIYDTVKANGPCDMECGDRFFKAQARCRHARTPAESIASLGVAP